ncbi:hypothetical protein AB3M83_00875 [Microbacterium sp. 179-B 1A2 NHS]|uniref:hypothetical protein n=1 Tax=Microbacterium sp. 179-B 1A2 NHS TaxID=3142383 RepID=UPI0039A08329
MDTYSGAAAGFGIGFFILVTVIYLAVLGLMIWISYLLMRTAVKNGVIQALRETGQNLPPGYRPPPSGYSGPGFPPGGTTPPPGSSF